MTKPQSELEQKRAQRTRLQNSLTAKRGEFETMQVELKNKEQEITALIATGDARKIERAGELRPKLTRLREEVASDQDTIRILEEELAKCETVLDELEHTEERDAVRALHEVVLGKQKEFRETLLEALLLAEARLVDLHAVVSEYQMRGGAAGPGGRDPKIFRTMQGFQFVI